NGLGPVVWQRREADDGRIGIGDFRTERDRDAPISRPQTALVGRVKTTELNGGGEDRRHEGGHDAVHDCLSPRSRASAVNVQRRSGSCMNSVRRFFNMLYSERYEIGRPPCSMSLRISPPDSAVPTRRKTISAAALVVRPWSSRPWKRSSDRPTAMRRCVA